MGRMFFPVSCPHGFLSFFFFQVRDKCDCVRVHVCARVCVVSFRIHLQALCNLMLGSPVPIRYITISKLKQLPSV